MMRRPGFNEKRVKLVIQCVELVSYSILVNGKHGEKFTSTKWLRQGNPLFTYLFILCVEGLSFLSSIAKQSIDMRGLAAVKGGIMITHLLFTDDCVIFSRAKLEDLKKIQEILQ